MKDNPWFIHDQRWSVLTADYHSQDDVRHYCQPKFYRITADGVAAQEMEDYVKAFTWHRNIEDIALNRPVVMDQAQRTIDFKYLAIIADAGVGKTIVTRWIEYRCNQPDSHTLAFRFDLKTLIGRNNLTSENVVRKLPEVLVKHWYSKLSETRQSTTPIQRLRPHLDAMLRTEGSICLILDGLDQCAEQELDILAVILSSDCHTFKRCRFVVGGRPQAYTTNWESLFSKHPWRLVRADGMNRSQQIRYLGWLPDGSLRHSKIPKGARTLLGNPRIMSYLRKWTEFSNLKTAADIYYQAIDKLIGDGMSRDKKASRIGLPSGELAEFDPESQRHKITQAQVWTAMNLLAVIAFETKRHCQRRQPPTWHSDWHQTGTFPSRCEDSPPAYDYNVNKTREVEKIRQQHVKKRCSERELNLDGKFETNWEGIASLNILDHSLFEDGRGGLKELVWANKSLHEFLLAFYFANLATEADTHYLWDWIYIKDQASTEDYYWFWQYLCEMPEDARSEENWLASIGMIYQPGIWETNGNGKKLLRYAKRSTEMIFRSWWNLQDYVQDEGIHGGTATDILHHWQSEFQSILDGGFDDAHQTVAKEIQDHLLHIPLAKIGRFKMGTSSVKQGFEALPESEQREVRDWFERMRQNPDTEITGYFDRYLQTKGWQDYRELMEPKWNRLARMADADAAFAEFILDFRAKNESEIPYENLPGEHFPDFELGRHPVSNRFFRLFDPGHGKRPSESTPGYQRYSETDLHPVIFVDWFDAWVYCRFLFWDGQSCLLPHEDQWECAAKFGFGWDHWTQPYWWGEKLDEERHKEKVVLDLTGYQATQRPSSDRANPATKAIDPLGLGLMDMLGNVWEWCEDPFPSYTEGYDREKHMLQARDASVSRSVRGSSFALGYASYARCSYRSSGVPANAHHGSGFRVSRARKS